MALETQEHDPSLGGAIALGGQAPAHLMGIFPVSRRARSVTSLASQPGISRAFASRKRPRNPGCMSRSFAPELLRKAAAAHAAGSPSKCLLLFVCVSTRRSKHTA
eukprot:1708148-Pyramimonas_sp.AAC.1